MGNDRSRFFTPQSTYSDQVQCFDCPARISDLCIGLSDSSLPALYEQSTHLNLEKGETLFLSDQPSEHIFNVREGTMTLYRMGAGGQRQILGFLFTGDLLGITPDASYNVSAQAGTDVSLCRWSKDKFDDFLVLYPAMAQQYRLITSKLLAQSLNLAFALGQLKAEQRLAGFLLHISQRQARIGGIPGFTTLPMSRMDIADYLGLTIETVSRGLTRLSKKKFISLVTRDLIELSDMKALNRLSQGEEV